MLSFLEACAKCDIFKVHIVHPTPERFVVVVGIPVLHQFFERIIHQLERRLLNMKHQPTRLQQPVVLLTML